jgi:hypothetical protein
METHELVTFRGSVDSQVTRPSSLRVVDDGPATIRDGATMYGFTSPFHGFERP